MRNWSITPMQKENYWNLESPMSRLEEIKKTLEPTSWDKFWVKVVKKELSQLLIDEEYKIFQEKIKMPNKLCDWLLWKTSLDYLIRYLVSVEDSWSNVVSETIRYIWSIFKHGRNKKEATPELHSAYKPAPSPTPKPAPKVSKPSKPTSKVKKTKETIGSNSMFWDVPIWKIVSYPTIKDQETGSYCCSRTARLNGLHFWISLPKWSAYSAWVSPIKWIIDTIPRGKPWKRPNKTWVAIKEWEFNSINKSANFADIYAESSTSYGHRAIAIRDTAWRRYILDPYIKINGKKSLKPIKLKDYITKWRKILKAHFYHSKWYVN